MKNKPKDYNCLEQIKSAIYLSNTRGEIGRKERDLEADKLLIRYYHNCDFASIETDIISMVFIDTTTTLIQAIESYRYGQFDSSMVMVRSAIDAATYASITTEPVYDHGLSKLISVNSIGGITGYEKYKDWDKRRKEIINNGFLTCNETDELFKIRNEGNFSAHYFEIKKDHFDSIVKIYESKHELPKELPRQFTTEKDNQSNLLRTFEIITKLQNNCLKFYKIASS